VPVTVGRPARITGPAIPSEDWQPALDAADRHLAAMTGVFTDLFDEQRRHYDRARRDGTPPASALREALTATAIDSTEVTKATSLEPYASVVADVMADSTAGFAFALDMTDPDAQRAAREHAARMVTNVNSSTSDAIAELLASQSLATRLDRPGTEAAIGALLADRERYVLGLDRPRLRQFQRAEAAVAEFLDLDARLPDRLTPAQRRWRANQERAVLDAVGTRRWRGRRGSELFGGSRSRTPRAARSAAQDYLDRFHAALLADRARTIARTEVMRATNMGRDQALNQAVRRGAIPPTVLKRWVTVPDDRRAAPDLCRSAPTHRCRTRNPHRIHWWRLTSGKPVPFISCRPVIDVLNLSEPIRQETDP